MSSSSPGSAAEQFGRIPRRAKGDMFWLLAPYSAALLLFLALPLSNILYISLHRYSPTTIWTPEITIANYLEIFRPYLGRISIRTLRIGATASALCVLLGYPIAYFLARCSKRQLVLGMFILMLPLMVSAVVACFGWIVILGRYGLVNSALVAMLGPGARMSLLYNEIAILIALVHYLLPLMVFALLGSIEKIPERLEEASINLGASRFLTFWLVIVPLSRPGLLSGLLLCFSIAISVVVTPALLGGPQGRMMGNEVYEQIITANNWPFAASLAVVLVVVIVLAMACSLASRKRSVP